jgi:hypothetical protein
MTATSPSPSTPEPTATELELRASIEGLQVQVRALAGALDQLCRVVELELPGIATSPEAAKALEDARWSLGEIW